MTASSIPSVALTSIERNCPGISAGWGRFLAEAAAHCLDHNGHRSGVELSTVGTSLTRLRPTWRFRVDPLSRDAWNDIQEMTEYGACCIAIILILRSTKFTVVRRARKGEGVDYWLSEKDGSLPFIDAARLEVSGIINGDNTTIQSRIKQKRKQTHPTDGPLPAYIGIVEFGAPIAHLVKK